MNSADCVSDYILGLRHVGIVTEDLDGMVDRLHAVFGEAPENVVYVPEPGQPADTRFAFFSLGGVPYEVIEPISEAFRELLLATDHGANHVCYTVSDLDAVVAAMAAAGVRLGHVTPSGIVELPRSRMAYFDPRDTAGLLLEFVEDQN